MWTILKTKKKVEKDAITEKIKKNDVIKEIHNSFYNFQGEIIQRIHNPKNFNTFNEELIKKYEALVKLGFTSGETFLKGEEELKRKQKLNSEQHNLNKLESPIIYFSKKYTLYKFISVEGVNFIKDKYNLSIGTVDLYIGDIPDKNLEAILNFKIEDEDCLYLLQNYRHNGSLNGTIPVAFNEYQKSLRRDYSYIRRDFETVKKAPLEIVAPLKDFKVKEVIKPIEDIEDPIVLQPVYYNNTKYYLIVTAWGEEASDELVVNNIFN